MKTSTAHLPHRKRRDLDQIVAIAHEVVGDLEMVILYGSYARGNFVGYDFREEYGRMTEYRSDYDIVLVTRKPVKAGGEYNIESRIRKIFYLDKQEEHYTPLQIIVMGIDHLNREIIKRRPFFTDIKREGIMLYDSGKFKLARRRALRYSEIKDLAQEYYNEHLTGYGNGFIEGVSFYAEKHEYKIASFLLHQAAENMLTAVALVGSLYVPKSHDLEKLMARGRQFTGEVDRPLPNDTTEEKRLFTLLRDAYVRSRYDTSFVVTPEDLSILTERVKQLREITNNYCLAQLTAYDIAAAEQTAAKPAKPKNTQTNG